MPDLTISRNGRVAPTDSFADALADEEARQVSRNYIRTRIGRSGGG